MMHLILGGSSQLSFPLLAIKQPVRLNDVIHTHSLTRLHRSDVLVGKICQKPDRTGSRLVDENQRKNRVPTFPAHNVQ